MKTDKILIYEGKGQKTDFLKACTSVKDRANELTDLLNQAQSWSRIETLADFEKLYDDPLKFLDQILISNVDLKIAGGRMPNPAVLASLLGVDRLGYMAALGISEPTDIDDCPTCNKKTQTVKVNRVKQIAEFYQYAEFIIFINGSFQLNNSAIQTHCDIFNVYAESSEQIALFRQWQGLCDTLNTHIKKYPIGGVDVDRIAKALKLQLSQGTSGTFVINSMELSQQIKYLR